jgi:hypothetical protein
MFFVTTRVWLNGKYIRFRWDMNTYTHPSPTFTAKIYDGEYLESSDTDFPSGSGMITKGSGLLQTLASHSGTFAAETQDILVNIAGSQSKCTVMFLVNDAWGSAEIIASLDWIEINGASGGSNNLYLQPMDDSVSMSRTGGTGDYGTLGSGYVIGPFLSVSYTTNGTVYRSGTLITNNSVLDIAGSIQLEALSSSNCSFIRWLINGTSNTLNPRTITVLSNTTVWCIFQAPIVLTGNATESDVLDGQTFYNNSTSAIRTGSYVPTVFVFLGNATEPYVFDGYAFYSTNSTLRYGTYVIPVNPGYDVAGMVLGVIALSVLVMYYIGSKND